MTNLSNAFSVLNLDVEDEKEQMAVATAAAKDVNDATKSDKSKKKVNGSAKMTLLENDNHDKLSLPNPLKEYKMPLVWIDLEMTGLNVEVDRILEIACVITDGKLTGSVEAPLLYLLNYNLGEEGVSVMGPDLVIHQTKECIDRMGEWCQSHHAASGLTKRVLQSTTSEEDAEKQVIEFVKKHAGNYSPLLAGNSVYVDLLFLKKYMPSLAGFFPHVLVDVTSIKALCVRWYPEDHKRAPTKKKNHRAMDDIKESILQLKYYKETIFKGSKSRQ